MYDETSRKKPLTLSPLQEKPRKIMIFTVFSLSNSKIPHKFTCVTYKKRLRKQIKDSFVNLKQLCKAWFNIIVWYSYRVDAAMIKCSASHDCKRLWKMTVIVKVFPSVDHDCKSVLTFQ